MKAQFTNLYIKNLDPETTQEEFVALFEPFGTVTSAVLQVDDEGKSKGFGFVNYANHDDAQKALDGLSNAEHRGRALYVSRAQKKTEREDELRKSYENAKMEKLSKYQGVNLYVKNLEDDVDEDKLTSEFEAYGAITSCKIMRDEKGTSKGFGFVCFSSPDEATKAVSEMNNKMIGTKPLYVSLAQRKDIRRQQLESQIAQRNHLRLQQAAAAGMPTQGFMGTPQMYYPGPQPYGAPPNQRGNVMGGYPAPGMMPPRGRYPPPGQQIPVPGPYGSIPPQGYGGVPAGYPRAGPGGPPPAGGVPPPQARAGPGAPPPAAVVPPSTAPSARPPPTTVPPTGNRPVNGNGVPPAGIPRNGGSPAGVPANRGKANAQPRGPNTPIVEGSGLTPAALAAANPAEQKQMLGEVIYIKIFA